MICVHSTDPVLPASCSQAHDSSYDSPAPSRPPPSKRQDTKLSPGSLAAAMPPPTAGVAAASIIKRLEKKQREIKALQEHANQRSLSADERKKVSRSQPSLARLASFSAMPPTLLPTQWSG